MGTTLSAIRARTETPEPMPTSRGISPPLKCIRSICSAFCCNQRCNCFPTCFGARVRLQSGVGFVLQFQNKLFLLGRGGGSGRPRSGPVSRKGAFRFQLAKGRQQCTNICQHGASKNSISIPRARKNTKQRIKEHQPSNTK